MAEKPVRVRWKVSKDIYSPGQVIEVAPNYAKFLIYHGYAELVDNICPECFEKLVMDSGCRTCLGCGWSKCG